MPILVKAIVKNREVQLIRPYPYDELREFWSYHPPGYEFMPKFKMGIWDGRIKLLRYDKVPTGLFLATRGDAEKRFGIRFDCFEQCDCIHFNGAPESDRDYQVDCVNAMRTAAQLGGGLVIAGTGTGKTRMTGMLFKFLQGSAVFIVDELALLKQAQKELEFVLDEKVGDIGNMEFRPRRITVATIQTLHRHRNKGRFRKWASSLQVMVIDEIHVQLSRKRNFGVVDAFRPPAVFGLTATLELQKEHVRIRAYALAGPVVFRYGLEKGMEEGYLTKGIVVQCVVENHRRKSRSWIDDYREMIVRSAERNDVVESIVRESIAAGRSVVLLVERIEHLKLMSKRLSDIPHRVVYGAVDVDDRVRTKAEFESDKFRLIITNKVFAKGADIKRVDCIVDAAGSKSRNAAIQKYGRGVRLNPGKEGLVYFDIADGENRFMEASMNRRKAFESVGIPVYRAIWKRGRDIGKLVRRAIVISKNLKPEETGNEETREGERGSV